MTIGKFFLFSFLQWLFLIVLKIFFFKGIIFTGSLGNLFFWVVTAVVVVALVRRLGILNYLEAIFISLAWIIGDLLADGLITVVYVGTDLFKSSTYWIGFLVLFLAVMVFHKKRHLHIRKEQAAHHH